LKKRPGETTQSNEENDIQTIATMARRAQALQSLLQSVLISKDVPFVSDFDLFHPHFAEPIVIPVASLHYVFVFVVTDLSIPISLLTTYVNAAFWSSRHAEYPVAIIRVGTPPSRDALVRALFPLLESFQKVSEPRIILLHDLFTSSPPSDLPPDGRTDDDDDETPRRPSTVHREDAVLMRLGPVARDVKHAWTVWQHDLRAASLRRPTTSPVVFPLYGPASLSHSPVYDPLDASMVEHVAHRNGISTPDAMHAMANHIHAMVSSLEASHGLTFEAKRKIFFQIWKGATFDRLRAHADAIRSLAARKPRQDAPVAWNEYMPAPSPGSSSEKPSPPPRKPPPVQEARPPVALESVLVREDDPVHYDVRTVPWQVGAATFARTFRAMDIPYRYLPKFDGASVTPTFVFVHRDRLFVLDLDERNSPEDLLSLADRLTTRIVSAKVVRFGTRPYHNGAQPFPLRPTMRDRLRILFRHLDDLPPTCDLVHAFHDHNKTATGTATPAMQSWRAVPQATRARCTVLVHAPGTALAVVPQIAREDDVVHHPCHLPTIVDLLISTPDADAVGCFAERVRTLARGLLAARRISLPLHGHILDTYAPPTASPGPSRQLACIAALLTSPEAFATRAREASATRHGSCTTRTTDATIALCSRLGRLRGRLSDAASGPPRLTPAASTFMSTVCEDLVSTAFHDHALPRASVAFLEHIDDDVAVRTVGLAALVEALNANLGTSRPAPSVPAPASPHHHRVNEHVIAVYPGPLFLASDVGAALGISNVRDFVRLIDPAMRPSYRSLSGPSLIFLTLRGAEAVVQKARDAAPTRAGSRYPAAAEVGDWLSDAAFHPTALPSPSDVLLPLTLRQATLYGTRRPGARGHNDAIQFIEDRLVADVMGRSVSLADVMAAFETHASSRDYLLLLTAQKDDRLAALVMKHVAARCGPCTYSPTGAPPTFDWRSKCVACEIGLKWCHDAGIDCAHFTGPRTISKRDWDALRWPAWRLA
jgi:hypothetical protein